MTARLPVDLWSLKIFLTVAGSGNMTVAAKRLDMTQPSISHAIQQMERALGVALIDRDRRPLRLTAAGNALYRGAERIVEDAEHLPAIIREAGLSRLPEIRLGLVDTFAGTAGPSLIRAIIDSASRLAVWTGLSPTLGQALIARQVDLIVTSDPLDDVDGLDRFILWREPFVLVLPNQASWASGAPSMGQLAAKYPMIRHSARSHLGTQIDRHLRRIGVAVDRRLEIDISDTVLAMVAAEIGWAITTPLCLLTGSARASRLLVVRLPGPRFVRSLSLVCRSNEYRDFSLRVVDLARRVLRTECLKEITRLWPWMETEIALDQESRIDRSGGRLE